MLKLLQLTLFVCLCAAPMTLAQFCSVEHVHQLAPVYAKQSLREASELVNLLDRELDNSSLHNCYSSLINECSKVSAPADCQVAQCDVLKHLKDRTNDSFKHLAELTGKLAQCTAGVRERMARVFGNPNNTIRQAIFTEDSVAKFAKLEGLLLATATYSERASPIAISQVHCHHASGANITNKEFVWFVRNTARTLKNLARSETFRIHSPRCTPSFFSLVNSLLGDQSIF